MRRLPLLAALCAAAALTACRRDPPPPYVRLDGAAPVVPGVSANDAALVSFWASWCLPCREETPALRALAEDPPSALRVVLVSEDADLAAVQRALGGAPSVPAVLDAGRVHAEAFGVDVLPASFLVVRGRLVARFDGARAWDSAEMRSLLARLVAESRATRRSAP